MKRHNQWWLRWNCFGTGWSLTGWLYTGSSWYAVGTFAFALTFLIALCFGAEADGRDGGEA